MINIGGYLFEGPYHEATTNFNEVAAVYVILDENQNKIDVGETDQLKTRLATHERRNCWERNSEEIYIAVYKEENERRRRYIEKEIRSSYRFPCGEE